MLLETLDIKRNDLIIYSENIFDLNKNFKVLYKDDVTLLPRNISFENVCTHVNEFTPKSLIVYRLLTNINDFFLSKSKFGFHISVNNEQELFYFDPIFALKEMEEYISVTDNYDLRFRIQQVGLTTLTRKNKAANYAEIYSVDLTGTEALNQNDKVFVDALLTDGGILKNEVVLEYATHENTIQHKILEVNPAEDPILLKNNGNNNLDEQPPAKPHSRRRTFAEFLKKKNAETRSKKTEEDNSPLLDIFYSDEKLNKITNRKKNMSIVLKLESEE